jgi:hypothetical protein
MPKSQRSKKRSQRRKSQRGGGWGFQDSFVSASGAPVALNTWTDDCATTSRPDPLTGQDAGRQIGGACGCMIPAPQLGGGSGTGGYAVNIASNDMGKVPMSFDRAPCVQRGGSAAQTYGISSYSAGYGLTNPVELGTGARYMDPVQYGRVCVGGSRKVRSKQRSKRSLRTKHRR